MNDASLDHFLGAKPSSRLRRVFSLGLLAVATVAAIALFIRFLGGTDVPYYSTPAQLDDFTPILTVRGEVHAQNEITVSATQDGVIDLVPGPGEGAVSQGRELAGFDPAPITQAVLSDRAALDEAQAALGRARVAATELATRLDRYENIWRRSDRRVPSLNELAGARADAHKTVFDLAAAQSRRDQARIVLAASRARQASAVIEAPASGFVTARLVQPGQYVHLDQPLFTLATKSGGFKVVVPISAAQARSLVLRAKARVLIDGLADQVGVATLAAIGPAAASSTQRQAVFTMDQPPSGTRPGMLATIETDLPRRVNVLLVPDAALTFVPGAKAADPCRCVYVLSRGGTPHRVDVAAGASDGSRTEVLSGQIEPGTKVIIGWRGGAARQ